MKDLSKQIGKIIAVSIAAIFLISSQIAMADNNGNGHGKGRNKNVGVGNASDGVRGRVITDKRIYYTGDPL
jgi:hypothetical protein